MKKIIITLLLMIFIIPVGFVGYLYVADNYVNTPKSEDIVFKIEQGENMRGVSSNLKENGVVKSDFLFNLYGRLTGASSSVKFGSFSVNENMNYKELYEVLSSTKKSEDAYTKITIPEGFKLEQIAKRLDEEGVVSKDEFIKVAKEEKFDYWFLEDVLTPTEGYKLEGFLYPQTYHFEKGISSKEVITIMLDEFDKNVKEYEDVYTSKELYEKLIMASIVERETNIKEEANIVAGVFYNRLEIDMKLESCATVEYVLDTGKKYLSAEDIAIDSEFNTYMYEGLTPTPICSPSIQTIKAVFEPANTPYFYFVAKEDGNGHYFSRTFEEHNEKVKQVKYQ